MRPQFTLRSLALFVLAIFLALAALDWHWKLQSTAAAEALYQNIIATTGLSQPDDTTRRLILASERWCAAALEVPLADERSIRQAHLERMRCAEARAKCYMSVADGIFEDPNAGQQEWLAAKKAREDAERQFTKENPTPFNTKNNQRDQEVVNTAG